jgi:hypothetical protein
MRQAERQEADRLFEEALESSGARDPRSFYRETLKNLKSANPDGYDRAVRHFQDVLVPSIAGQEAEPLRAWREYGRLLAELTAQGRTVAIEETGRARPYDENAPLDHLVLHLPDQKGARAILVSLPRSPSPAQRATYDLLVAGKHRVTGSE